MNGGVFHFKCVSEGPPHRVGETDCQHLVEPLNTIVVWFTTRPNGKTNLFVVLLFDTHTHARTDVFILTVPSEFASFLWASVFILVCQTA